MFPNRRAHSRLLHSSENLRMYKAGSCPRLFLRPCTVLPKLHCRVLGRAAGAYSPIRDMEHEWSIRAGFQFPTEVPN